LSLANKHSRQRVEEACRVALGHGTYRLRALRQIIEHHSIGSAAVQQNLPFIQQHAIIRDLGDYARFVRDAVTGTDPLPFSNPLQESSP
jgi:hypothetical protein